MPLSKDHKAAARGRIVSAAGKAFRARGFDATSVAGVMSEAGLTHGGFYAHFPSKQALFAEVATHDHDLLTRLKATKTLEERAAVLDAYLDPSNFPAVSAGCTLSSLAAEAARQGGPAADGMAKAFENVATTLVEAGATPSKARAAICLAVGALTAARSAAPDARDALLHAAREETRTLLAPTPAARPGKGRDDDWSF